MSRRRRRGSRRKSSSSSKRSVSPYTFHKTRKSNSVSYKDDITEKGETDSFRKENVLSGSDEEENVDESTSKEKTFRRDFRAGSILKPPSTTKQEERERGIKIITSVTIDNSQQSSPVIVFEQSRQSSFEDTPNCPVAVTTTKVQCIGSKVKFEIQELLQPDNAGIRTTFVFQSQHEGSTEAGFQSQCERTLTLNDESFEQSQVIDESNKNKKHVRKTLRYVIPSKSCGTVACRKSCCDNDPDFALADGPARQSPTSEFCPEVKGRTKRISFNSDALWDTPAPHEFEDSKYDILDSLSKKIETFQLGACSSTFEDRRDYSPPPSNIGKQESGCPYSLEEEENAHFLPFFDQLSESDSYDPMSIRPSLSVSRSSYTEDFIDKHEGKTWMRNNSVAIVEHKACSSASYLEKPMWRRRTFPGVTGISGAIQESLPSYRESFSSDTLPSFVMQSLPRQIERLGPGYQGDDRLSQFIDEDRKSSQSSCSNESCSSNTNIRSERQQQATPFDSIKYEQSPEEVVSKHVQFPEHTCMSPEDPRQPEMDFAGSLYEDMVEQQNTDDGGQVEESEVSVTMYDEEQSPGQSPMPIVEENLPQGDLLIQVIPPCCTMSEEHVESSPTRSLSITLEEDINLLPKGRRGSVMTIVIGGPAQRSVPTDSRLAEGSSHEKQHRDSSNAVSEVPSVSPIMDMEEGESSSIREAIDDVQPTTSRTPTPRTSISSPSLTNTKEKQEEKDEKEEAPSTSSGCVFLEETKLCQTVSEEHSKASLEMKEHLTLTPDTVKDFESGPEHWEKKRKVFKESKQWSSAGGNSIHSDITEETDDTRSMDVTVRGGIEDKGFYTETYHSASWIYRGDEPSGSSSPPLRPRPRPVTIRERTVKIHKGVGDYPWGFRIQFSKPIVVTEVDTNGAAEEAGLLVGDYVMTVNGTDVTNAPHSEAADLARQGPDLLILTIGSDIGRGPNTPRPACRGYLHKRTQSGLIKGWRERWFVLRHDCCLYYYRHKRDEGRKPAVSTVKLEGAEVGVDTSLGKPFVFKCCPLSTNRVYFYCTTSNQDMKRWLEAMERAVHPVTQKHVWLDVTRHNAGLPPLAVKSPECLGLLHQIDSNKDTWVQHYCILKDGCLYFYGGIRSNNALGGLYLHGYTVREQPLGSKKSTIELRPPSDEFKTFHLCAENETENKRWILAIRASINKWVPLHQDYMHRPAEETRIAFSKLEKAPQSI